MKKLILAIAIGWYHQEMAEVTHPLLRAYAAKVGADFKVVTEQKISNTTPHWEKFQIARFFDEYDRIIFFDTDIIVRADCPDLFEIVPQNAVGAFNEGKYEERPRSMLEVVAKEYGVDLGSWDGRYYNTGVMVLSQTHKAIFEKPEKEIFSFYEQTYLNLAFIKARVPMHELDYRFNRMACMDKVGTEHRLDSYVVHYAGYEDPDPRRVIEAIKNDREQWKARGFAI